jgi:hypothetical protein
MLGQNAELRLRESIGLTLRNKLHLLGQNAELQLRESVSPTLRSKLHQEDVRP